MNGFYEALCERDMVTAGQGGNNLAQAMSSLSAKKTYLTGHSMGGAKAQLLLSLLYMKKYRGYQFTCLENVSLTMGTNYDVQGMFVAPGAIFKNDYSQNLAASSYVNRNNARFIVDQTDGVGGSHMLTHARHGSLTRYLWHFFFGDDSYALHIGDAPTLCLKPGLSTGFDVSRDMFECYEKNLAAAMRMANSPLEFAKGVRDGMPFHPAGVYAARIQALWDGAAWDGTPWDSSAR